MLRALAHSGMFRRLPAKEEYSNDSSRYQEHHKSQGEQKVILDHFLSLASVLKSRIEIFTKFAFRYVAV